MSLFRNNSVRFVLFFFAIGVTSFLNVSVTIHFIGASMAFLCLHKALSLGGGRNAETLSILSNGTSGNFKTAFPV